VSTGPELFSAAQRTSIGVCLSQFAELVQVVRGFGVEAEELDEVDREIESFTRATGARRPPPPRNALNAALAQMLVLEQELRPRRLRNYGEVGPEAERVLDAHVEQLVELTNALIARLQARA
jgi:hypothetical protein